MNGNNVIGNAGKALSNNEERSKDARLAALYAAKDNGVISSFFFKKNGELHIFVTGKKALDLAKIIFAKSKNTELFLSVYKTDENGKEVTTKSK